jgi:serine/threonine-protein kinase RsbW
MNIPFTDRAVFSASLDALQQIMEWLHAKICSAQLTEDSQQKIEVAAEEAIVNVIHYAYLEKAPSKDIDITTEVYSQEKIIILIKDKGIPFDPTAVEKSVNVSQNLDERTEGGLGIVFMRNNVDDVCYRREGIWNILTLVKNR